MPGFLGGSTSSSGTGGEISFPKEFIDPVTKLRISQPENLIDTDFEYGLQPTKWETVELINNTPSFFSKSGDTTIPNIVSITTNAGTREITVVTALEHGLAVGIPISVTGTKSTTADGSYIINSIPNSTTFTYLCKDNQSTTASIEDLYSSIITGEFFQGSQLRVSDSDGIVTDGESISTLTVTTPSTHGFGVNTPFYFLNLNSTISQEFQAANTAAKSFDSSNSATAQTFDGSNTLASINIDWSNSGTVGGVTSTISSVSTTNGTITVSHGTENFNDRPLGTPLYYNVVSGAGFFNTNPRGVVFLKTTNQLGTSTSTFQVSDTPDGTAIPIESSMSGTFQLANQSRTFAGNNTSPSTETSLTIVKDSLQLIDAANDGGPLTSQRVATVSSYSAGVNVTATADSGTIDWYVGTMVLYTTTGSAATGLTNNTTYFIDSIFQQGTSSTYTFTIRTLPGTAGAVVTGISGGTGTQRFTKIGVSVDKDIFHIKDNGFQNKDMIEYVYPVGGKFTVSDSADNKNFFFVTDKYDNHNFKLNSSPNTFVATGGTITTSGAYTIHTFTSTQQMVVAGSRAVDILYVGGGGGSTGYGGGGGGGGVVYETNYLLTTGTYNIEIGAGGQNNSASYGGIGGAGSSTVAFGQTTIGGCGGRNSDNGGSTPGANGGGGGSRSAGYSAQTAISRARTANMTAYGGFAGGRGIQDPAYPTGGGGGAAQNGGNNRGNNGGLGGSGVLNSINGSNLYWAGGGNGMVYYTFGENNSNAVAGSGGVGGGGGGWPDGTGQGSALNTGQTAQRSGGRGGNGGANTGGGGGAGAGSETYAGSGTGAFDRLGGYGGSGVVIVRYLTNG